MLETSLKIKYGFVELVVIFLLFAIFKYISDIDVTFYLKVFKEKLKSIKIKSDFLQFDRIIMHSQREIVVYTLDISNNYLVKFLPEGYTKNCFEASFTTSVH